MIDWGSGYVTDTDYVHNFSRAQAPAMLALAALSGGVLAAGGSGEPLAWCDLGCGQGYTANLIAAANPQARIFGFDFNPSHIANARALAAASRLTNADFREASFEELDADPALPDFDIMCMHGVFGWVSPDNRGALVALARKRLKPGGLLYISYDCLPGWAAVGALRRVFVRHFAPGPALKSPAAIDRAFRYSDALKAADSRFHRVFPHVEAQMERLKATPSAYLAHELLPRDWEAFLFGDVAAEFAKAKLDFVGPVHLADAIDRLNFTDAQVGFLGGLNDPVLAESTRDIMLCRQFRRDVFAKGSASSGPLSLRARWLATRFAPTTPESAIEMAFDTAVGKRQFHPEAHAPLVEALRKGPITLGEAIKRAFDNGANFNSLIDAIRVLVSRGDIQPALPADGDEARAASTRAFNDAVLARAAEGANLAYLASPVTGGGVKVDRLTQLYLFRRRGGGPDLVELVANFLRDAAATADSAKPLAEDEARATAREKIARIETEVAPMLGRLGIA